MQTELLVNPPQTVFDELIQKAAETDEWPHQSYEYRFLKENLDGFWLLAIVERESRSLIVGACLALNKSENEPLYSIGLYYCVEEYRGKGHGSKIFKAMMDIVGDSNACLAGVVGMSEKYAKHYGFDKISQFWYYYSTIQMENLVIPAGVSEEITTKNWLEVDEEALSAYDSTICPRDRKKLMRAWFGMDRVYTRVAFDENQRIVGYASIRAVNLNRICAAPFYADNLNTAERLLTDILETIPNVRTYSSVAFSHPEINANATKLLQNFSKDGKFEMEMDFKTQFTRNFIKTPDEKVYSVADNTHQFV